MNSSSSLTQLVDRENNVPQSTIPSFRCLMPSWLLPILLDPRRSFQSGRPFLSHSWTRNNAIKQGLIGGGFERWGAPHLPSPFGERHAWKVDNLFRIYLDQYHPLRYICNYRLLLLPANPDLIDTANQLSRGFLKAASQFCYIHPMIRYMLPLSLFKAMTTKLLRWRNTG